MAAHFGQYADAPSSYDGALRHADAALADAADTIFANIPSGVSAQSRDPAIAVSTVLHIPG